jgi:sulfhydrogenase subunit beta (sulfur reductase)
VNGEPMEKIITKQSVPEWIKKLEDYTIYAPIKNEDIWSFEVVPPQHPEVIDLNYLNSAPSPKHVVFPPKEVYFEFTGSIYDRIEVKETLPEGPPRVILGIRPCDAAAIARMDEFFSQDVKDPYYLARRNNTILVGLVCNTPPSPNCFCTSVGGSPHGTSGLDILMTDLGDDLYYVESLTQKGVQIMDVPDKPFRQAKSEERSKMRKIHSDSDKKITQEIKDMDTLDSRLDNVFNSSLWEEESMGCIRCGICTYLCPSCHCFDVNDEVSSTAPLEGKRVRTWDNCQFPDFTMHSSGHNPRPERASRLRQRIFHKFRYSRQNFNNYLCTGCGRCVSKCPVGINIIEILNKI